MPGNLQPISALQTLTALKESTGSTFAARQARDVPKDFEAFVLQSFIQEMLPKKAEGVYGSGIAGDIWRSMLAELVPKLEALIETDRVAGRRARQRVRIGLYSFHTGGVNILVGDGSVRFLSESTSTRVVAFMITSQRGEIVPSN